MTLNFVFLAPTFLGSGVSVEWPAAGPVPGDFTAKRTLQVVQKPVLDAESLNAENPGREGHMNRLYAEFT